MDFQKKKKFMYIIRSITTIYDNDSILTEILVWRYLLKTKFTCWTMRL